MANVQPFAGIRFDSEKTGLDLANLVAPCFDQLTPAKRKSLLQRHPWNFVRLLPSPGDTPSGFVGSELAPDAVWQQWLEQGVLKADSSECFYLVKQTFTATREGIDDRFTRVVLLASLTLPADAPVEPLLRATSPMLFVHDGDVNALQNLYATSLESQPLARALDEDSVEHSLYRIDAPTTIQALIAFFQTTKWSSVNGQFKSNPLHSHNGPRQLAALVAANDPALVQPPQMRLYRGIPEIQPSRLFAILQELFAVETLPWAGSDAAEALLAAESEGFHTYVIRWKASEELWLVKAPLGQYGPSTLSDEDALQASLETKLQGFSRSATPDQILRVPQVDLALDILDRSVDCQFLVMSNPLSPREFAQATNAGTGSLSIQPGLAAGLISLPT